jgi:hypothetical protein
MVEHYRKKILKDLDRLFRKQEFQNMRNPDKEVTNASMISRRSIMAIITISRGSFSKGKQVAESVARKLGYQCVSRDIVLEASREYNIPEIKLMRAIHDAPSIFKVRRARKNISPISGRRCSNISVRTMWSIMDWPATFSSAAYRTPSRSNPGGYGRSGSRRDGPRGVSREEALNVIKKDDDQRRRWSRDLYGIDTWDAALYDLVIHTRALTTEDAAELISQTARLPQFATTPQSRKGPGGSDPGSQDQGCPDRHPVRYRCAGGRWRRCRPDRGIARGP